MKVKEDDLDLSIMKRLHDQVFGSILRTNASSNKKLEEDEDDIKGQDLLLEADTEAKLHGRLLRQLRAMLIAVEMVLKSRGFI